MAKWNLAHIFHDGTGQVASGAQVTEDLEQLKEKIELLEEGFGPLLQLAGHGAKVAGGKFIPAAGFDNVASRSRRSDSIPHGLGVIPKFAVVSSAPIDIQENGGATLEAVAVSIASLDITNINVISTALGTTNNGTDVYWLAIG